MRGLRKYSWTLVPLTSIFFLVGCWSGPQGESTEGRNGKLYFSFTQSAGCELGCTVDQALVPNTKETVVTHLTSKQADLNVASSNTSIFKVVKVDKQRVCLNAQGDLSAGLASASLVTQNSNTACDTGAHVRFRVVIETLKPGQAELQLKKEKDVFDSVEIKVDTPRSLKIELTRVQTSTNTKPVRVDPLALESNGVRYRLRVLVVTKEGSLVQTTADGKMKLSKQSSIRFSGNTKGSNRMQVFPRHNEVTLVTGKAGDVVVDIHAGGLKRRLALRVVN